MSIRPELVIDSSLDKLPGAEEALRAALLAWQDFAPDLPEVTLIKAEPRRPHHNPNSSQNTISFAYRGEPRTGANLAVTVLSYEQESGSIVDADIIINGLYRFGDAGAEQPPCGNQWDYRPLFDLQNVLTHELGHWFGLEEDYTDPERTMYAFTAPQEIKKRSPTEADRAAVEILYVQDETDLGNETGCGARIAPGPKGPRLGLYDAAALALLLGVARRAHRPTSGSSRPKYRLRRTANELRLERRSLRPKRTECSRSKAPPR